MKKAFVAGKTFFKMIILGLGQLQLFNSKNHMLWDRVNVHVYYWILKWLTTNQKKVYYRLANLHQIQTLLSFIPSFCNFVFTSYQAKLIFCDLKCLLRFRSMKISFNLSRLLSERVFHCRKVKLRCPSFFVYYHHNF